MDSSSDSESLESQTIVITPTQLEKMGLTNQLRSAIQGQPQIKRGSESVVEVKSVPTGLVARLDDEDLQKSMKNKLCTLLNHTPLVMQVKDVSWMNSEKQTTNPVVEPDVITPNNIEDNTEEDVKPKFTIVSNEKFNFSASEIENMLSTGKSVTTADNILTPLKTYVQQSNERLPTIGDPIVSIKIEENSSAQCERLDNEDPLALDSTKQKVVIKVEEPEELQKDSDPVKRQKEITKVEESEELQKDSTYLKRKTEIIKVEDPGEVQKDFTFSNRKNEIIKVEGPEELQKESTYLKRKKEITKVGETKELQKDSALLKKQCLKRIQAKMYENLKKVLDEVDSLPVKDKASLCIKPCTNPGDSPLTRLAPTPAYPSLKPVDKNRDSKESKPCYMSTFREKKMAIKVTDNDVIEISDTLEQPDNSFTKTNNSEADIGISSPLVTEIIKIDDDGSCENIVKIPKKRGRPPKDPNLLPKTYSKHLLKSKDKTDSDSIDSNIVDYNNGDGINKGQSGTGGKIVRKRGRPPKKSIVHDLSDTDESVINISPNDQSFSAAGNDEKKTPKKRGRPRKVILTPMDEGNEIKDIKPEPPEERSEILIEKSEQTPRKRGRPKKIRHSIENTPEQQLEQQRDSTVIGPEQDSNIESSTDQANIESSTDKANIEASTDKANIEASTDKADIESSTDKADIESSTGKANIESSTNQTNIESSTDQANPTPRKRGRPRKIPIAELDTSNKNDDTADNSKIPVQIESEGEPSPQVKIPKKRGRKPKSEMMLALKKEMEKVKEEETFTNEYGRSKSGRKRKVVNYTQLNGEDSDIDESDSDSDVADRIQRVENFYTRKMSPKTYNAAKKNKKISKNEPESRRAADKRVREDQNENSVIKKTKNEIQEIKVEHTTIMINNELYDASNTDAPISNTDQVKCSVCDELVDMDLWPEHKKNIHNNLAWTHDEEPLVGQVECLQ